MAENYFMFYVEASIVCIVIFVMLLVNDSLSFNKQEKQIAFDHALMAHIVYFIVDVIWAGMIAGKIARPHWAVVVVNFGNFVLLAAIAFTWARFAAIAEHVHTTRIKCKLCLVPWIGMSLIMVVTHIINPYLWVHEDGELNNLYYVMFLIAPLTYVFAASIMSFRQWKCSSDPSERASFLMIALYPLAIVGFGILQLAYLQAPLFCFGCTLMMLFFYIRSMEDMISLDSLTKLNNRGQLFRYASQEASHIHENERLFVLMIDADEFKYINDTYGHAEGDRALIVISDTLKTCANSMSIAPFLSRYGGDEFVMILHVEDVAELDGLIATIHARFEALSDMNALDYYLSVSIGCEEWNVGHESFQDCLHRADIQLYEEKRARKTKGTVC